MPTRKQLERLADEADAAATRHEDIASQLREQAVTLRALAAKAGDSGIPGDADMNEVLHKRLRPASINGNMDIEHRLRISEGSGKTDGEFRKAIRAKNFTQNKLAKAIGVNQAVLSLHRQKLRRIPLTRAKAIERLTGWPADSKHWPCGFVTDGD